MMLHWLPVLALGIIVGLFWASNAALWRWRSRPVELPDAVAVHRARGLVMLDNSECIPVETWLDADGDETDDWREADVCVARLPGGKWLSVDLRCFERAALH